MILNAEDTKSKFTFKIKEWILIIVGLLIITYTWLYDYGKLIIQGGFTKDFFTLAENEKFSHVINSFTPVSYNWPLFVLGLALTCTGIFLSWKRTKKA